MSGRASLTSDPQEHYALNILTQAAMHTRHNASSGGGFPSSREGQHPNSLITNQRNGHPLESTRQSVIDEYNASMLSSRDLDVLAFNTAPQTSTQHSYLSETYSALESQLGMAHANNLRILNAESYDDGRGSAGDNRRITRSKPELPFGIADHPRIRLDPLMDVEEHEAAPRCKKAKIENGSQDGEDGPKGKTRGRPRVNPKDETAADRRRTQIRMAQRAYRHRKESTISSLEKKVQELNDTNEEMSSIFISLYDFAVSKGLLQREPEFGQQLQATTERFLTLAKATADAGHDENQDDSAKTDEGEHGHQPNGQRGSPKRDQDRSQSVSEPLVSEPTPTYGGYILTKDEAPDMDISYGQENQFRDNQYKANSYRGRPSDIQVITRPTEDNASFPFDFMDLQQYRVEVPPTEEFSQTFSPLVLPPPKTYAYNESSLSRRIHRVANERALQLVTSDWPDKEERFQRVFRFSLMYTSKEDIISRLQKFVHRSAKDTLQNWRAPFVHVGGAGTHYPLPESDPNWDFVTKFGTGFSMGPFTPEVTEAQELLDDNMKCSLPGFEGYFFDANDVEGYLRGRGLDIPPAADFVEVELDALGISDPPSPKSTSSESVTSKNSPQTPKSPFEAPPLHGEKASDTFALVSQDDTFGSIGPVAQYLPFPLGFTNWDDDDSVKADGVSMDSLFSIKLDQNPKTSPIDKAGRIDTKRKVTVNVNVLIEEIIKRGVCLGRTPGFKPTDVDDAILAAVKAGSGITP